jgi:hypothetical protein
MEKNTQKILIVASDHTIAQSFNQILQFIAFDTDFMTVDEFKSQKSVSDEFLAVLIPFAKANVEHAIACFKQKVQSPPYILYKDEAYTIKQLC